MKEVFFNNIKFLIGENQADNWNLLELCTPNFIWFHLDKMSSPYVIICDSLHKNKQKKIYLNYAASLCKENSKMCNLYRVKVIYTQIKNIIKGNKIGSVIIKKKVDSIII